MTPEIMTALNKFENALQNAVRRDMKAEQDEQWEAKSLKAADEAWKAARAARRELESTIQEELQKHEANRQISL